VASDSGHPGGPQHYGDALGHQEALVISLLFDPRALDHRAIIGDPFFLQRCSYISD